MSVATDLTTKTAQSLHAEWCRQMREKGFHGPVEACTESWLSGEVATQSAREDCKSGFDRCRRFHADLIPWPDLPESRRQEYLVTAKVVLPEIVGEVFSECARVLTSEQVEAEVKYVEASAIVDGNYEHGLVVALARAIKAIRDLRDRCLEELKDE